MWLKKKNFPQDSRNVLKEYIVLHISIKFFVCLFSWSEIRKTTTSRPYCNDLWVTISMKSAPQAEILLVDWMKCGQPSALADFPRRN